MDDSSVHSVLTLLAQLTDNKVLKLLQRTFTGVTYFQSVGLKSRLKVSRRHNNRDDRPFLVLNVHSTFVVGSK